jgi:polygalacturonase
MNTGIKSLLVLVCAAALSPSILLGSTEQTQHTAWKQAEKIVDRIVVPSFPDRDFSIADYGAQDGAKVLCTEAFRQAIDACHRAGGGRVVVPPGRYLVGAIHLKSKVNLHLSKGAVLLFSRQPQHYLPVVFTRWEGVECMNYSAFIYAFEQENIAVTGQGIQDVHLENCQFRKLDRGNKLEHAQDISFKNVTMNSRPVNTVEQANSLLN